MNNLDMYTREKANKIHLDELHREAQNHRMLRDTEGVRGPKYIAVERRLYIRRLAIALSVVALIAVIAFFLVASNMGLLHTL
ncbi:MAG: hypothetical protein ABSB41_19230 [Anaerolineales bacterium]